MKTKTKAIVNLLLFIATIVFNALGVFGYINGLSQKVVSDRFDTFITPGPFAFSIWGVLYTLLLITLLYWLFKHSEVNTARLLDAVSPLFWVSSVFNIAWIVAFSYELIGLSTLFILGLMVSLSLIIQRLNSQSGIGMRLGGLTFGLYGGWILIATFVNVAAYLVQIGWNGFGIATEIWAIIVLVLALAGTWVVQNNLRNAVLTLPIAWAYAGIWYRHSLQSTWQGKYPAVGIIAVFGVIIALAITVIVFIKNKRCVLPLSTNH